MRRTAGVVVLMAALTVAACSTGQDRTRSGIPTGTGSGALVGHLYGVGGPAPGRRRPWSGSVTVSRDGQSRDVPVSAGGGYSVALAAGRYTVVGHSPAYGDGRYPCPVQDEIQVTAGAIVTLDVYCQLR